MKFLGKEITNKTNDNNSGWATWLYYSPSDFRCCLFDFSYIDDDKIILLDGISKYHERVNEMSIDKFIKEYGDNLFLSIVHWKVKWNNGISYNN